MSFWNEVREAVEEGYDQEEVERKKDSASLAGKVLGGVGDGVHDLATNPIRWLGSIFLPRP